jgi:hypothetical protein
MIILTKPGMQAVAVSHLPRGQFVAVNAAVASLCHFSPELMSAPSSTLHVRVVDYYYRGVISHVTPKMLGGAAQLLT